VIITELFIPGRPITKGSLTRQGDRLVDTPQSKAWRRIMAGAIRDDVRWRHMAYRHEPEFAFGPVERVKLPYPGPVVVYAAWFLPVDPLANQAGDVDKVVRNLLDALSAPGKRTTDPSLCAGAIVDDNQVQHVDSWEFLDTERPGVLVRVGTINQVEIDHAYARAYALRNQLTA
jgi:hypothetical protein